LSTTCAGIGAHGHRSQRLDRGRIDERVGPTRLFRQPHQRRPHPWIVVPGQLGEQFAANAIAGQVAIRIGRVRAIGHPAGFQIGEDLLASHTQQRAHQPAALDTAQRAHRRHAGQSAQTGAAHDPVQHGFGLIVRVVADGDVIRAAPGRRPLEEAIALAAGKLFPRTRFARVQLGNIHMVANAGQAQIGGEGFDERGIGIRIGAANPVMQVGDMQAQRMIVIASQRPQTMQQGDRVRPSRNAHHHDRAARQQFVSRHKIGDPRAERSVGHESTCRRLGPRCRERVGPNGAPRRRG
jgi:hypothetical protein